MLRYLPEFSDPNILLGLQNADDAGVYRLTGEMALVFTVDVFTPVVDDPRSYGAIAAANAFSDIYAKGGRPLLALNILAFPQGKFPLDVAGEILRGGAEKAKEAGVVVIGGHTLDDPEPKYGMAVVGTVHPTRVVTKAGAKPGDVLFLTKPLGMGVITTGIKHGRTSPETVEAATRVMATLNRQASEAMVGIGASACTDVTGYGLLGHLVEMTTASRVCAVLFHSRIPILAEARKLAREGMVPGGTYRNREFLGERVRWHPEIGEEEKILLYDAQTSGGLLIAVPRARAEPFAAALQQRGVNGWRIGEIIRVGDGTVEVLP